MCNCESAYIREQICYILILNTNPLSALAYLDTAFLVNMKIWRARVKSHDFNKQGELKFNNFVNQGLCILETWWRIDTLMNIYMHLRITRDVIT